jgi:predicted O-methyltransferase YrrM
VVASIRGVFGDPEMSGEPWLTAFARALQDCLAMTQGLKVAVRAAVVTAVIGLAAYLVAPRIAAIVTVVGAAGALGFELARVRATLSRQFDELAADLGQVQPMLDLRTQLPTRRPLPAMREFAIAPDFALFLAELVAAERPRLVVETGSGVSTLVLAYALEKLGRGRVVALEHDPLYAARTRAEIELHGLAAYASVVDAPIEPITIDGTRYRWHAVRALEGLDQIDLVVDDGPPRYLGDMLRYASLPTFAPRLSPHGVFVFDVIGDEEREVLARWKKAHPAFHQAFVPSKKGAVILRGTSPGLRATSAATWTR